MSRAVKVVVAGIALSLLGAAPASAQKVLVFTRTVAFRHDSIDEGIAAVQALGAANGFAVDATEDAGQFNDVNLARYKAVVFLSTTGDVLNDAEQSAFERYIGAGGGYVGVHAAADTEYGWAWYGGLVGAYFQSHPAIQNATVEVIDRVHPATAGLPKRLGEDRRVVQLPRQPAGQGPRPGRARREHLLARRRHDGRRSSDRVVPDVRRRAVVLHRHGPHAGVLYAQIRGVPRASGGRHPVGGWTGDR